jgi:hypothetical protein
VTKTAANILFIIATLILLPYSISLQSIHVYAVKFTPIPFSNIPIGKIISDNGEYKLGADFSIDFGDETVIQKNIDAESVRNMTLDKEVNGSSLEFECDSNDECGTNLAPMLTKIYLVKSDVEDNEIAENSVPALEIESSDCSTRSIRDCANFNFTIPNDAPFQNYKIVLDVSFDEAKWIFINAVKISK